MNIKAVLWMLPMLVRLSAQSSIEVEVVQPIQFGNLVVSKAGGSIRLTEEGVLNPISGGVWQGVKSKPAYGVIRIFGPANAQFQVVFETPNPLLTGASGKVVTDEMTSNLTGWMGKINVSGMAELHLGAQLSITAGALPGPYQNLDVPFRVNAIGIPGVTGTLAGTARKSIRMFANLMPSITLERLMDLDFGGLVPGTVDGLFQVLPQGGCASLTSGGPKLFRGRPTAAAFTLTGAPGANYSIQLPEAFSIPGPGGASIRVQDFSIDQPLSGVIPPSGQLTFGTGASMLVASTQPPGAYAGQFVVTVSYQ